MAVLTERANGRRIELSPGERFEIRLQERPTTGFRWQLVSNGAPVCALVADHFTPPRQRVPGEAGRHTWTFRVKRGGHATIELAARRPWDPETAPAQVFRVTVIATEPRPE